MAEHINDHTKMMQYQMDVQCKEATRSRYLSRFEPRRLKHGYECV